MSPEMLQKQMSGKFTDFWALGTTIYEMLAGKPTFTGNEEK